MGDEAALGCHYADFALICYAEEMLRVVVGCVYTLAIEIVIQVLEFLVAGKEHQAASASGRSQEIVNIDISSFR